MRSVPETELALSTVQAHVHVHTHTQTQAAFFSECELHFLLNWDSEVLTRPGNLLYVSFPLSCEIRQSAAASVHRERARCQRTGVAERESICVDLSSYEMDLWFDASLNSYRNI